MATNQEVPYMKNENESLPKYSNNNYLKNTFIMKRRNMIMCANCGGLGHVYRTCNHPTISYGFICYRIIEDFVTNTKYPVYLMVQRKDSLSYVEFMRGKYELENKQYLLKIFTNMTDNERSNIKNKSFDVLWKEMWCKTEEETSKTYNKEYLEASHKFKILSKGYYINNNETDIEFINIEYLLNITLSVYNETEWGFPKGRRNFNENDLSCALREFKEETGYNPKSLQLCSEMKPLEEVFSGTNKKRYKHVYYIAKFNTNYIINEWYPSCKEIKDAKWFNYQESQNHIRNINIERKELLKRLNSIIFKNM
jgi:8-oxo-dGTP pyrophosphatase MutT (NUDIX family)